MSGVAHCIVITVKSPPNPRVCTRTLGGLQGDVRREDEPIRTASFLPGPLGTLWVLADDVDVISLGR